MKAIKYVLAGALLLGSVAPTMAQQNEKAIIDHVSQVIKNKGADFEKQVNQLYKENKKDAACRRRFGKEDCQDGRAQS